MRKIFFVAALLMLLLCGCTSYGNDYGESHSYLIASIGFDKVQDGFLVTAEAVAVNSEDTEGKKRILITGVGNTPEKAFENAESKATQPFNLGHCGVIAVGSGVDYKDFLKICDFCYDTDEITFCAYMIAAGNAFELLESDPISSVAAGYDIMSIIKKEDKNKKFENTLYEVVAENLKKDPHVKLPLFTFSGEYRKIEGLQSYETSENKVSDKGVSEA